MMQITLRQGLVLHRADFFDPFNVGSGLTDSASPVPTVIPHNVNTTAGQQIGVESGSACDLRIGAGPKEVSRNTQADDTGS